MSSSFQIGDPPIDITYRRNARARRMSLRISNSDGAVKMTLPGGVSVAEAQEFALSKEGWLRKHLGNRGPAHVLTYGARLMIDGVERQIAQGPKRAIQITDTEILTNMPEDRLPRALAGFCKTLARDRFSAASRHYADKIDVDFTKITMRDTRSRWGSCTTDGGLMYSWRLIMAPREVQYYVAAHEVCHLIEMNHSDRFWDLVESIYPNYKACQKWLRQNGSRLHQVQF